MPTPYCDLSDLQEQFSSEKVSALINDLDDGPTTTAVVNKAITDADNLINSYVGRAYTLPLETTPALITTLSCDIALYNLRSRRKGQDDVITKRYEDAKELLKNIAKGKASLGEDGATEPAGGDQTIQTTHIGSDRTFTIAKKSSGSVGSLDDY